MTTDSQVASVIRTVEHSHDANLERVEATKIISSMKESAGTRRAKPAQLYADHTQYATALNPMSIILMQPTSLESPRTHPLGSPQCQHRNPLGSTWSTTSERVRKVTKQLQDRLFSLCQSYSNDDKTLIQTLKGIGQIIRWK